MIVTDRAGLQMLVYMSFCKPALWNNSYTNILLLNGTVYLLFIQNVFLKSTHVFYVLYHIWYITSGFYGCHNDNLEPFEFHVSNMIHALQG